jgi:hypothetical protein
VGTSVVMIDQRYGHLVRDAEDGIRARLEAATSRSGIEMASGDGSSKYV